MDLEKAKKCCDLLEPFAQEVVKDLIKEIEDLRCILK